MVILYFLQSVSTGPVCIRELRDYQNHSAQPLSTLILADLEATGREKEVVWAVGYLLNAANATQNCVEGIRQWLCVKLFTSEDCETPSSYDQLVSMTPCPENTVRSVLETSVYLQNCVLHALANGSMENIMGIGICTVEIN